ncbi:hypothetical protein [Ethanoligenens harbinense]|uniref:Uncharacterized protein n=1 Tax=Ethanoligenens harbinense (strain DSM 18485 / JCM 12961 / CGMCC 1.5033 / YUAN-3) TaxID=663278 RepID=E6U433_ETHHY|nr:hypothetical protein [Ethanoligenens harbinense]ADU27713.1 hypothetical protein Ethha_2196 [Ethanoligenens harbinense YUAN-3]AVQ96743.1 hypothetical protein CXQ68_11295 [Ethanoligenens harbinense YUAN-3]AYF39405.1 hypothetical protein CXP51_11190 [Ethanoligenens harbinense]AYF42229.1 hypothetical protein CN246_11735 [Ethanoligenens harbinense]QCN92985.1 hypothetical protein DRA42_11330 [Ethanoligenens harbinense]
MNDYLGTGTGQQHCACETPAGMANTGGSSSAAYQTGTAATGVTTGYNAGISQGGMAVLDSTQFLNGYLRSFIGRSVTVEFLFGTGTLSDRTGTLMNVGANYITLREFGTSNLLVCDFFSIKLVRVYQG